MTKIELTIKNVKSKNVVFVQDTEGSWIVQLDEAEFVELYDSMSLLYFKILTESIESVEYYYITADQYQTLLMGKTNPIDRKTLDRLRQCIGTKDDLKLAILLADEQSQHTIAQNLRTYFKGVQGAAK
jgi:hypothetical protein